MLSNNNQFSNIVTSWIKKLFPHAFRILREMNNYEHVTRGEGVRKKIQHIGRGGVDTLRAKFQIFYKLFQVNTSINKSTQ